MDRIGKEEGVAGQRDWAEWGAGIGGGLGG